MKPNKRFLVLAERLSRYIPASRIYTDPLYTLAKGTDAGFYRLIPGLVVRVESEDEVIHTLRLCYELSLPVTFKAGGTSLSGQTITDSVLIETGDGLSGFSATDNGRFVKLQCGITGGLANARLAIFGKRIGPDPASIHSARMGGIVSNNASGGALGIKNNSYSTLRGMRVIFADGTLLDTRDADSRSHFSVSHASLLNQLRQLAATVRSDSALVSKIRHKYEIKNTCGYGVNSLVDFEDPFDILEHILVGAEGTLGFISEVTLETVEEYPMKATSLIFFPSLRDACNAIPLLSTCRVTAAELMDRNALRSVQGKPGMPSELTSLGEEVAALLIDTAAMTREVLNDQVKRLIEVLSSVKTVFPVLFTDDRQEYEQKWKVRKGLFASAAAMRPTGTACIIEDLAFRTDVLADALTGLRKLIGKYGYQGSVIWGHVLDGNIHFVIMPDFNKPGALETYSRFMDELVHMTVHEFDGSLKGEHGTGRNMAPFVREEWGDEIYRVMQEVKRIFDPANLLNPGVILNNDPTIHLKNIKLFPAAHSLIDPCIECGFCEKDCPSRSLTLTPRQRIVVFRELSKLATEGNRGRKYKLLKKGFHYHGDATCATDGLCALSCPVEINTGKLIKELRFTDHSRLSNHVASFLARHIKPATAAMRLLLDILDLLHQLLGTRIMKHFASMLHKASGKAIPLWNPYMPKAAGRIRPEISLKGSKDNVVYFPACINRSMGTSADYNTQVGVIAKTESLLKKAGFNVIYPSDVNSLCCGMAFESKGFTGQGMEKAAELGKALMKASGNGQFPVYCDMSPCLLRMKETLDRRLRLYDPVEFILEFFPGRLDFMQLPRKVTIHSTCSNKRMGLDAKLGQLAALCAREVVIPDETGCCGWAGDRGFTHPELNASALKTLKASLGDVSEGYSTSRTCEIGLSLHSGISYKSIVYLVDEATNPVKLQESVFHQEPDL